MVLLGLDVSSKSTGWAILENDKLIEYGKINPTDITFHCQKLNLFFIEINKLLNKYQPDEVAIEETVYVKNSKAFRVLTRTQAMALLAAYQYLRNEPKLYEPSHWKKQLDGCKGNSKKCEIQLAVCRKYNLLSNNRIEFFENKIVEIKNGEYNKKEKNKKYSKMSIEIYSETGINNDIADAIGIVNALKEELK